MSSLKYVIYTLTKSIGRQRATRQSNKVLMSMLQRTVIIYNGDKS